MRLPRESPWSSQRTKGYQMQQVIETHLPHLSQPQLAGLALWVAGLSSLAVPARTPSPRPSPPGATGTACASISGSGSTTAATGPVPAGPNWT